jgi:hypothetical protein
MTRISRRLRALAIAAVATVGLATVPALPAFAETGPGSIVATFVAADTGEPAAEISVFVSNPDGYWSDATTDAEGVVTLTDLALGTYSLATSPTETYSGEIYEAVLTEAEPNAVVVFERQPWPVGDSSVTFTVTDAATDLPLEGASVSIYEWETGRNYPPLITDASGVAAFSEVAAGSFFYSAYIDGYVPRWTEFELGSSSTLDIEVALVPANATIVGTVRDEAGNPIPSVVVYSTLQSDPGVNGGVFTDEAGEFAFMPMGAGEYSITAGGPGTEWTLVEETVVAIANETVTLDLVLTPRTIGSISGYVLDGVDFGSWHGICVILYDVATGEPVGGTTTGEGGSYHFGDLDAGEYSLAFWDCDNSRPTAFATSFSGGAPTLASASTYVVAPGEDVHLNEHLIYPGGAISGHVELATADGTVPLPPNRGMVGTVYHQVDGEWEVFPNYNSYAGPGEQGDYLVRGLPAGEYRVGFSDSQTGARAYAPLFWSAADTIEAGTTITVSAGETVAGIDGIVSIPEPTEAAVPVPTEELQPEDEGAVTPEGGLQQGGSTDVTVGAELAGEWLSVFGHSTPTALGGWVQVATDGTIQVTVPKKFPTGAHTLVVQDAEGTVVGWVDVTVTKKGKAGK